MNIELMRRLDYWLGRPLCFLLSLPQVLNLRLSKKRKNFPVRKIAFLKLSEMGAIILTYPLLARIKEKHPHTDLYALTFAKNKETFEVLGGIIPQDKVLVLRDDSPAHFMIDALKAAGRLRREKIDIIFDLEFFSRISAVLAYLSRAPKRVGFYRYSLEGLYRGRLLTHRVQYNPFMHISKAYLCLDRASEGESKLSPDMQGAVTDEEVALPEFKLAQENRQAVYSRLEDLGIGGDKKIYLVNPGDGVLKLREWPLDNFLKLSRMLLEDPCSCVILAGRKSRNADELYRLINCAERCLNLAGKTTPAEFLDLCWVSCALISSDGGIAHLASLSPVKKIILFGPESPRVFGPLGKNVYPVYRGFACSPCMSVLNHRRSACKNNLCLQDIGCEEVYRLVVG